MGLETEEVEERLKSFLAQLNPEIGILHRIVYKSKNQHRRSAYFQFLLKVRSDLRHLQSANLEKILNSCFLVIHGNRPSQKLQLLESLKRTRSNGNKHNFLERLLGVARLLSQMVEPILKAAMEISTLLARSFFMGFSLTVLALLARLRVLIQQILLDVVCTYNAVSSLAQKKQAIKISEEHVQVYREYHPIKDQPSVLLECVWQTDKYVLSEKINGNETQSQGKDIEDVASGASAVNYHSIEFLLGENEPEMANPSCASEVLNDENNDNVSSAATPPSQCAEENQVICQSPAPSESPLRSCSAAPEGGGGALDTSSSPQHPNPLKRKHESKGKVAFVSVKVPATTSGANATLDLSIKKGDTEEVVEKKEGR